MWPRIREHKTAAKLLDIILAPCAAAALQDSNMLKTVVTPSFGLFEQLLAQ